ncbi:hypothetical protein ACN9MY_07485 [Pseudoduganella sp. R-31]|uniref:hypothetical protein n=1 Tax=Pseudoduganella sp. R-31 TaxID=3404060 RepID=UPI003CE9EC3E
MTTFCPSVETFSSIGNDLVGNRDALEKKIATLEDVAVEVVREYMDHRMFPKCEDVLVSALTVVGSSQLGPLSNV